MDFFVGRYAIRYGKVAGEAIKKQMAQIPGGLVRYSYFMQHYHNLACSVMSVNVFI